MPRPGRLALLSLIALMAAAIAATPADAAKRKVPFGFFGTAMSPELSDPAQVPDAALTEQMGLMARSGVETVRAYFNWARIQPARGSFDWSTTDRLVGGAARRRMAVTANVMITPPWASSRPGSASPHLYAPRDPRVLAAFMRRLVLRYGPRGTFWAANPALPRVPVRQWQLYNEQMAPWMWKSRPWAQVYTRLLKAAYPAIHRADRGAKVVAGSLVHVGRFSPWDGMRALYEAGAKRYFDVVAIHPFTNDDRSVRRTVDQVIDIVDFVRDRMRTFHDARKPVILTELTWSAAVGKLPERSLTGLETTPRGQVARMKAVYRRLAKVRRKHRIAETYWYTWATQYDGNSEQDPSFRYAGLTRWRGGVFSPMPILRVYASLAARYEGCRKTSNARRCR